MRSSSVIFFRSVALLFVAVVAVVALPGASAQAPYANHLTKRIVGDYGYWSKYQTPAYGAPQIPYTMLTHINHAGVSFDASGHLSVPDGFLEPELNNMAHAAGVKVLLLLGGDFNGLETSGAVQTLVNNIKAFNDTYHYDGLDIDWEYPETAVDTQFLVKLMNKLRQSNEKYTLSIDVAPWGGSGYDVKSLQKSTDYFNMMMYDCAGPWTAHGQLNSPIFWDYHNPANYECEPGGSAREAAKIFMQQTTPAKLNIGTPFYGYYYTNINSLFGLCPNAATSPDGACDDTVQTINYAPWAKSRINKDGWVTAYDPIALVPYMLRADGSNGYVTYDDSFSTYYRVWYCDWELHLGGAFMWSLDADYDGHSQDLLSSMYSATVTGTN
jgi:chitinase